MNKETIKEKVCEIINDTLGKSISLDEMKKNGLESVAISSMTFLTLITTIENEFDFEFDDDEINYAMFGDFDRFCNLIIERIEKKNGTL